MRLFIILLLQLYAGVAFTQGKAAPYGGSSRLDYWQTGTRARQLADSVASIWLYYGPEADTLTIPHKTLLETYEVCPGTKFSLQPAEADCTGFLVGPDLLLTAGHCVSETNQNKIRVVFGYAIRKKGEAAPVEYSKEDVYTVTLIARSRSEERDMTTLEPLSPDYALLRLNKEAAGRKPLKIDWSYQPASGDRLFMIGHSLGLPVKITPAGSVLNTQSRNFFTTNLNAFSINSGSPVFNEKSGKVVGIAALALQDFILKNGKDCLDMRPYDIRRSTTWVTRISFLRAYIP